MYDIRKMFESAGGKVIEGVTISDTYFTLICVHSTGLYVLLPESDFLEEKKDCDIHRWDKEIDDKLYKIQKLLSVSRGKIMLFVCDDGQWYFLNPHTEDLNAIYDIDAYLEGCLNSGVYAIEDNRADYFAQKLAFGGGKKESGYVIESEGELYVNRGGRWFPASEEDPNEAFRNTCLFGVFGWGAMNRGKKMAAPLYAITCGLFGVGWLADVLSFLTGNAVDREGRYYQPLTDKKKGWLMFLGCIAALIPLVLVYTRLLALFSNGISSLITGFASSGRTNSLIEENIRNLSK